jgi:hypothetical protein
MVSAIKIDEELILALRSELHLSQNFSGGLSPNSYAVVDATLKSNIGIMQQIDDFCTRLRVTFETREQRQKHVVILTGNNDDKAVTTASMLLGSYLILCRGNSIDSVLMVFRDLSDRFIPLIFASTPRSEQIVTVQDCWRALGHALRLGWFAPPSSDDEPMLDVGELAHYAHAANGGVQIVAPGALLLFPTPSDSLPDGAEWADSASADGSTARRFSPRFYASLLADLGVSAAAGLGRTSAAAARAFAAAGVGPADLRLPPPAPGAPVAGALLPALDRLLTLARGAPGGVAVHCGSLRGWPASPLGVVAAAFLVSRLGFSGAEAAAWVQLVALPPARPGEDSPGPE